MTTTEIAEKTLEDNQEFIKAVIDSVEEKGRDFVFQGNCRYFDDETNAPACLFGHALAKVGYTGYQIKSMKSDDFYNANSTIASVLLEELGYDDAVSHSAGLAQAIQDGRRKDGIRGSWGETLDKFLEMVKHYDQGKTLITE